MRKLFSTKGNWYKGNLHMHTTKSDGEVSQEEAVRYYEQAGYNFIAITDHWIESTASSEKDMLLLSGCEWDTGDMINRPVYHILGIGMKEKTGLERSNEVLPQTIINKIREAGGIAILAHPAWSLTDPQAVMKFKGITGCEIYNTISDVPFKNGRRADSSGYVDFWATRGNVMNCFAGDDCHFYTGEQLRSFIMVQADNLTQESILMAIKNGNFYASQGPEFYSVDITDDKITVDCSYVDKVIFYSNTVWCHDRAQTGGRTKAIYEIKPTDRFVRVELIDEAGKMAWTSPFLVNQ